MTWEQFAKEKAAKATPGRWLADGEGYYTDEESFSKTGVRPETLKNNAWIVHYYIPYEEGGTTEENAAHIAHCDPTTIALVAEVVRRSRAVSDWKPEHNANDQFPLDMYLSFLEDALAALDAHTKGNT